MSNQHYNNDDLELTINDVCYTVDVHATGNSWYQKATRWEPEDGGFELDDVDAVWYDEDGNIVEETPEMQGALDDYLRNKVEWEDDDPPEPDYEEREMARWEAELDRCGL